MNILDRYLAIKLGQAWLLVLSLLAIIFGLFTLIDELDHATANYQTLSILQYVALTTPQRILDLFPVVTLTGTLIAFANLARSSELVVIQSIGMPYRRQLLSAAMPALLLMLALWPLGEFIAAPLYQHAESTRQEARTGSPYQLRDKGLWSADGDGFYHIATLDRNLKPGNLQVYQFDQQGQLTEAYYAGTASVTADRRLDLESVQSKRRIQSADGRQSIDTRRDATREITSPWSHRELASLTLSPASMSLLNLYSYLQHRKSTGQELGSLQHLFWQRLMLPIMTAMMVLLAFQLSHHTLWHRDPSFGRQVGAGATASIFFYLACQIIYSTGTLLKLDAILVAVTPILLILAASVVLERLRP